VVGVVVISTSSSSPSAVENQSSGTRCVSNECEEVLAACTSSKIPQLYATLQDAVMALGLQKLPRRRKS